MSETTTALFNLLAPFDSATFLAEFWCKRLLKVAGASEKFTHLFGWGDLNRILHEHRLKPPRLLLFRGGRQIDPANYLTLDEGTKDFALNVNPFCKELEAGATLVLNNVDEMSGKLSSFTGELERHFNTRVHANLYASWRIENGFRLHWDDTDTFIIQLSGNKQWCVYEPTVPSPLRNGMYTPPPAGSPLLDELLEQGSLLYVPRGWWHLVTPTDVPSLHITLTLQKPIGSVFVKWALDQAQLSEACRSDVPAFADYEAKARYVASLTAAVISSMTVDGLDVFLASRLAGSRHHEYLALPTLSTLVDVNSSTQVVSSS